MPASIALRISSIDEAQNKEAAHHVCGELPRATHSDSQCQAYGLPTPQSPLIASTLHSLSRKACWATSVGISTFTAVASPRRNVSADTQIQASYCNAERLGSISPFSLIWSAYVLCHSTSHNMLRFLLTAPYTSRSFPVPSPPDTSPHSPSTFARRLDPIHIELIREPHEIQQPVRHLILLYAGLRNEKSANQLPSRRTLPSIIHGR
jgi:hypothetical protein